MRVNQHRGNCDWFEMMHHCDFLWLLMKNQIHQVKLWLEHTLPRQRQAVVTHLELIEIASDPHGGALFDHLPTLQCKTLAYEFHQ